MECKTVYHTPLACGCAPYAIVKEDKTVGQNVDYCDQHVYLLKESRKHKEKHKRERHYNWIIIDGVTCDMYKRTEDIVAKYPKLTRHIIFNHIVRKGRRDLSKARLPDEYKRLKMSRIHIPTDGAGEYLRHALGKTA